MTLLFRLRNLGYGFLLGALIAGGLVFAALQPDEASKNDSSTTAESGTANPGKLEKSPFVLEPPEELLNEPLYLDPYCFWGFPPDWDAGRIRGLLERSGLDESEIESVLSTKQFTDPGVAVGYFPPHQLILDLSPPVRRILYGHLSTWPFNAYHAVPFALGKQSVSELAAWAPHEFSAEFLEQADASVIQYQSRNRFCDYPVFAAMLKDQEERLDFAQLLARTRCQLASLAPFSAEEAPDIIEYWSARGRNQEVVSVLNSSVKSDPPLPIDLIHLLPPVPRSLLFTFAPRDSMVANARPDCFWTTRNFFAPEISQRFLDITYEDTSFAGWLPVSPPYELGDVILVLDEKDTAKVHHACNYLADDLVFTKNGSSRLRPWVIQTLDDMKDVYHSEGLTRLQFLRHASVMEKLQ